VGADPADAQAGPEELAHRADGDHGFVEGGGGWERVAFEGQIGDRLVDDERRAGRAREGDQLLAVGGREREAGGVLVVEDQVGEPGRCLAQGCGEHLEVPAVLEHRHRNGPRAGGADRVKCGRVGRMLDQHAVAGPREHAQQQGERVQRPGGHEHLVGRGRRATGGQVPRDLLAQDRQPGRVVARTGQVPRQLGGGRRERRVQRALGRGAGRRN